MLPVVVGSEVRDQVRHRATVVRRGEVRRKRRRGTARTTQLQWWHVIYLEQTWVYAQTQIILCLLKDDTGNMKETFPHRWIAVTWQRCTCVWVWGYTCGYIDGCICLSSELLDPDFPALWEEMAASASGRLSSSSWLLMSNSLKKWVAYVTCRVTICNRGAYFRGTTLPHTVIEQ